MPFPPKREPIHAVETIAGLHTLSVPEHPFSAPIVTLAEIPCMEPLSALRASQFAAEAVPVPVRQNCDDRAPLGIVDDDVIHWVYGHPRDWNRRTGEKR